MYYWNQDNFTGLKSIGEKYSSIEDYKHFGDYCLKKEKGLKKMAIVALNEFVSESKNKPQKAQRIIAEELASLGFYNREVHQLLAFPLVVYLKDVLNKWIVDDSINPIPYKWLGYVFRDISYYEKALQLDPNDEVCIYRIAQACLNEIDFQTHHLSESKFLGDFKNANLELIKSKSLINRLSSDEMKSTMQSKYEYYLNLLESWDKYSKNETNQPFPEWCASRGEEYNFWSIVYYEK